MAVPARRTSKAKKRKRQASKGLKVPGISFNPTTGEYQRSHHISLKKYQEMREQA